MKDAIVIVGGGGHAKVVASMVLRRDEWRLAGYTDVADRGLLEGAPYLGRDSVLEARRSEGERVALALGIGQVGNSGPRRAVANRLAATGFTFLTVVSTRAEVAQSAVLGGGTVVMPNAVVNACGRTGVFAIVNTGAVLEHDCVLGDHAHLAPGAIVCGDASIGADCFIGAGAVVGHGVTIPAATLLGAGCVVTRSLSEPGLYVGCPARRVR